MDENKIENSILKTHCSWELPARFVKLVSQHQGVTNLNSNSINYLATESTSQIFTLLLAAKKVMQQCKRNEMKKSDIINALKLCTFEHLYGHYSKMNYSIQPMNHSNVRMKGLMTYADKEFDLESYLVQAPIKLPKELMLHGHWLSINGVVPEVVENITQQVSENVLNLCQKEKLEVKVEMNNLDNFNNFNNLIRNEDVNLVNQGTTIFSDNIPMPIERQV